MHIFLLIMLSTAIVNVHAAAPAPACTDGRKSPMQEFFEKELELQQGFRRVAESWIISTCPASLGVRASVSANVIALQALYSKREQQKKQEELLTEIRDLLRAQNRAAQPAAAAAARFAEMIDLVRAQNRAVQSAAAAARPEGQ